MYIQFLESFPRWTLRGWHLSSVWIQLAMRSMDCYDLLDNCRHDSSNILHSHFISQSFTYVSKSKHFKNILQFSVVILQWLFWKSKCYLLNFYLGTRSLLVLGLSCASLGGNQPKSVASRWGNAGTFPPPPEIWKIVVENWCYRPGGFYFLRFG